MRHYEARVMRFIDNELLHSEAFPTMFEAAVATATDRALQASIA